MPQSRTVIVQYIKVTKLISLPSKKNVM